VGAAQLWIHDLDQVAAAARAATATGPICLTILPQAFIAGGVPIDASETVVADLAALCHRHGVGAVNLDGKATREAWQTFFMLLARILDDKCASLYRMGKVHGGVFLGRGQEALSVSVGIALRKGDIYAPMIRDLAGRLAFGEPQFEPRYPRTPDSNWKIVALTSSTGAGIYSLFK
jgi:hypothetical protein